MLSQFARKLKDGLARNTIRFANNRSGAFAPIFGVTAITLMLSAGAAFDYSQASRARSLMAASLDSAILAAGHELADGENRQQKLRKIFEDHLFANLTSHPQLAAATQIDSLEIDPLTGDVEASLKADMETAFLGLAGIPSLNLGVASAATFSSAPVEISMVLDVTGSMNSNGKLDSLKQAAAGAIDVLLPENRNHSNVRVGLVPYSEGVRLPDDLAEKASGKANRTCMTERKLNPAADLSFQSEPVGADRRADCSNSEIEPLTGNRDNLLSDIADLRANGFTAGHSGIAWGYYMLSDKWKKFWPTGSEPEDYDSNTRKIVILMTDGEFNTYFQGVRDDPQGGQAKRSNQLALNLCKDMKKEKRGRDGITIYTIAFDAPRSAQATLKECATPAKDGHNFYFEASNAEELAMIFQSIAVDIKSLHLTR